MTTPEIAARLADAFATIEEYRDRLPAEIDSILADAVCDTVVELTNHLQSTCGSCEDTRNRAEHADLGNGMLWPGR